MIGDARLRIGPKGGPPALEPADGGLPAVAGVLCGHLDQEIAESEDGAEGPRAFREKRKPVWKMR
jgi:hypothetical protein